MFLRSFGTHLSLAPQKLLLLHQEQNQCLENKLDVYIPQRSRGWQLARRPWRGRDQRRPARGGSTACAWLPAWRGPAQREDPTHARCAHAALRACPPAWRAGRGAHPPGEKGEGHADLGRRRLWAAPAAALLAGGRLGFVDREGSGRGISTDTNGRWPARPGYELGILLKGGTMDISPAEAHLSELLYRYLLTEHG